MRRPSTILLPLCLLLASLTLSGCGGDDSEAPPQEEISGPSNDNARLFGTWTREHKAGSDVYVFEESGRFVRKTYGVAETTSATCSQGLYEAKNDILSLYVRGGNGGWKIEIQPYIVDGDSFSLTEVYQRNAEEGESGSFVGTWTTFEESYQIIPEVTEPNPCEIPGEASTPDSLCCEDALAGVTRPGDASSWPVWTLVNGDLALASDNTSEFLWAKTDAKGNVYVDPKGGETEVEASGTWTSENEALYVSDESAVKEYKLLSPTLMYEVSPSWVFTK